jgi:hypothetical protein
MDDEGRAVAVEKRHAFAVETHPLVEELDDHRSVFQGGLVGQIAGMRSVLVHEAVVGLVPSAISHVIQNAGRVTFLLCGNRTLQLCGYIECGGQVEMSAVAQSRNVTLRLTRHADQPRSDRLVRVAR